MKEYKSLIPKMELKYTMGDVKKVKLTGSVDSAQYVGALYDPGEIYLRESMIVVYLNSGNNTIGWQIHSQGGTSQTTCDVKHLLITGLLCGASAMILSHNHPSGGTRPSQEDKVITNKVRTACTAVGINLLDHIIIGENNNYYSFADEGNL